MTSYLTQTLASPVISPLVSKQKGSMGNRMDCVKDQAVNAVVTGAAGAGTILGAAGLTKTVVLDKHGLKKSTNFLAKVFDKGVGVLQKFTKSSDIAAQIENKLQKAANQIHHVVPPTSGNAKFVKASTKGLKAYAVILPVALTALSFITGRGIYKMGQIDQKYTDKAQLQNSLENKPKVD